MTTPLHG